ncbi:MAG: hypothetical protein AB7M05_15995 [Alphaproteobacteria bacterium]
MVPVFIHPGFSNTGTSSLQINLFSKRADIFFVGEPYKERGGIFTAIRSLEDMNFDGTKIQRLSDKQIFDRADGRPIVISDETLTEAPQLFFRQFVMPRDVIAMRLKMLFPEAKIIFTIREQRTRIASMYLNLKRNYAKFSNMPIPPFDEWFDAMISQVRSEYLHNLDYTSTIDLYCSLFGERNVHILPIELPTQAYYARLCAFMGLTLDASVIPMLSERQNRRLTIVEDALLDSRGNKIDVILEHLKKKLGSEAVEAAIKDAPPAYPELSKSRQDKIVSVVCRGNRTISEQFKLDLAKLGYAVMER